MTDFEVDLTVPDAAICYLKPRALRVDTGACNGLDVAAAEQGIPPETRLIAIIRFSDWGYTVSGSWQPKRGVGPMFRAEGREFFRGAIANAGSFKSEKQEPDFLVLNNLQVLRFTMVSADTNVPNNAILMYLVVGKNSLVSVAFLTDSGHLGRVKEIAEKTMASLKMPPEHVPASWSDLRATSYSHAFQAVTKMLMSLFTLAGICVGAVFLYRAIRRSRASNISK